MVAPPVLVVTRGVADLRCKAHPRAEVVDQAHYGETLTQLASREGWHYVQADDRYFGWIDGSDVAAGTTSADDARVVAVTLAQVHGSPDRSSGALDALPAGTVLPRSLRHDAAWLALADGRWIAKEDTLAWGEVPRREPTSDDLLRTAQAFLGVPYLWGGTSALGLDCSGLVQQVYRLNGIQLGRDVDQQATEGRPVELARAGDLIFFEPRDGVDHIAIATGERTFIHAPGGGSVEMGELPAPGRTVRGVRRYLP